MTKQALETLVLEHATIGRKIFAEQRGSFRQQAMIVDRRGAYHMILIGDEVLHGPKMRGLLTVMAASYGGADVILVQADARMEAMEPNSKRIKEVEAAAARGEYIIADDPKAAEVFITCGRSREHSVCIFQAYTRKSDDEIIFDDPAPEIAKGQAQINLIPNIWERVH